MPRLNGSLIGFGRMGITHYAILNTHPDVKFTAVCDPQPILLRMMREHQQVETFSDYREMFRTMKPDFAVVCTPTASHAEIGIAAAESGIHIFLEKPLALEAIQGAGLAAAVEHGNLVNQVGYFLRFHTVFNAVKELLTEGLIGAVTSYKNEMYGRTVLRASKESWRAEKKMGGGCMMDFGSHCLDLSDYFFGPVVKVAASRCRRIYSSEVEDAFESELIHESGLKGSVHVNWSDPAYRRPYNRIAIRGTKGEIIADRQEYRLRLEEPDPKGRYIKGWNTVYLPSIEKGARFVVRGPEFTHQLDHFIEAIVTGKRQTRCSFVDALRTDRVMEMIREESGHVG